MKTKKNHPIFKGKIEDLGHEILSDKRYKAIVKKEIGGKSGIYALYNKEGGLYYIGKANSIMQRIKYHRKDRQKWERFSVFLTQKKPSHLDSLEDACISIAKPEKNKQKPLRIDKSMKKRIEEGIDKINKEDKKKMLGERLSKQNTKKKRQTKAVKRKRSSKSIGLKNTFPGPKVLKHKDYKGKEYNALWLKSGRVKYNGKKYNSPHAVAQDIVNKVNRCQTNVYGKSFWRIKKRKKWVKLSDLKQRS